MLFDELKCAIFNKKEMDVIFIQFPKGMSKSNIVKMQHILCEFKKSMENPVPILLISDKLDIKFMTVDRLTSIRDNINHVLGEMSC